MKDLFGHDIPDTPSMQSPLPYLLWEFLDASGKCVELWAAQTREQARECFAHTLGGGCEFDAEHVREMYDASAWEPYLRVATGPCCFWTDECGEFV